MADPDTPPDVPDVPGVIQALGRRVWPDGAILTSWVLISEWMDHDGEWWVHVATDDQAPVWRHQGIIAYAAEHDLCQDDDDDD